MSCSGLFVAMLSLSQATGQLPVAALFDIETAGLSRISTRRLTDYLFEQLAAGGGYQLVPSSSVRASVTAKKAESYAPCYDDACQIELGKAVAAQIVLRGTLRQLGSICSFALVELDLKTELTGKSVATQADGKCDDEVVQKLIARAAHEFGATKDTSPEHAEVAPAPKAGAQTRLESRSIGDSEAKQAFGPLVVRAISAERSGRRWMAGITCDYNLGPYYVAMYEIFGATRTMVGRRYLMGDSESNYDIRSESIAFLDVVDIGDDTPGLLYSFEQGGNVLGWEHVGLLAPSSKSYYEARRVSYDTSAAPGAPSSDDIEYAVEYKQPNSQLKAVMARGFAGRHGQDVAETTGGDGKTWESAQAAWVVANGRLHADQDRYRKVRFRPSVLKPELCKLLRADTPVALTSHGAAVATHELSGWRFVSFFKSGVAAWYPSDGRCFVLYVGKNAYGWIESFNALSPSSVIMTDLNSGEFVVTVGDEIEIERRLPDAASAGVAASGTPSEEGTKRLAERLMGEDFVATRESCRNVGVGESYQQLLTLVDGIAHQDTAQVWVRVGDRMNDCRAFEPSLLAGARKAYVLAVTHRTPHWRGHGGLAILDKEAGKSSESCAHFAAAYRGCLTDRGCGARTLRLLTTEVRRCAGM